MSKPYQIAEFQSTRPVWGATFPTSNFMGLLRISIHAPRVGRDGQDWKNSQFPAISIHAPRVGRDCIIGIATFVTGIFQSTRPVWGATESFEDCDGAAAISIHAPRVGRDGQSQSSHHIQCISIHAPRVGRDNHQLDRVLSLGLFQSTRPVWGATANLTILPRQICTKGTKEFLLGRKTHGKKGKIK